MTIQMKDGISGYITSGILGTIFTIPIWEKAGLAILLGACGAIGGLVAKFIWNKVRDYRKKKGK